VIKVIPQKKTTLAESSTSLVQKSEVNSQEKNVTAPASPIKSNVIVNA
jgi:hypothetical protein